MGVLTAGHGYSTFQGECPPPPGIDSFMFAEKSQECQGCMMVPVEQVVY